VETVDFANHNLALEQAHKHPGHTAGDTVRSVLDTQQRDINIGTWLGVREHGAGNTGGVLAIFEREIDSNNGATGNYHARDSNSNCNSLMCIELGIEAF
jgi:hypothetical protein